MDIIILTPIKVEYQAVRKYLKKLVPTTKENCNYERGIFLGKHQSFQIGIRQTGSKNATIALATEKAIQHFKPSVILLVGIAGGVKDVAIGDIVVATKAYGYAAGKETDAGYVGRPNVFPFSPRLLALAERVDQQKDWLQRLENATTPPKVYFGPIASDDKVIASTESTSYKILKQFFNDTIALEMESIGFAEAVFSHNLIHAINIRCISDLLDDKAKTDEAGNQKLAATTAATFAFELIFQLDLLDYKTPKMERTVLVKAVYEYIQPNLDQLMGKSENLPANPYQQLLWEKVNPIIADEIEELKADPTDVMILNSIPSVIRKFLKSHDNLAKELIALVEQLKNTPPTDATTFSNNKYVFNKSQIHSEGDLQFGDKQTVNNYGNVDKQWNIKENKGDFNFNTQHGDTTNIEQQRNTTEVKAQHNMPNNQGHIHIGDIINIQQVLANSPEDLSKNDRQTTVQSIHQLIGTNKIKAALEQLLALTKNGDSSLHNQVILLTNRWNRSKQEKHAGILTNESSNIEQNRILAGLLSLLEEL